MKNMVRQAVGWSVALVLGVSFCRGQENTEADAEQPKAPKHHLTFQVSYFGSAERAGHDAYEKSQTNIDVNDRFNGTIEVRPSEEYDLPTGQTAETQLAKLQALQAAVLAGDKKKLEAATPPLVISWFPHGDNVSITGTISETKTSIASQTEHGETRASSDYATENYSGQKIFGGSLVNAFVKIYPEEQRYDIQFTLMPDMASTWEAVHQTLTSEHREEGHDTHSSSEAKVPLDMGPGQMGLGYSNYQIVAEAKGLPLAGEATELIGHTRIPVPKPAGWDGAWNIALEVSWQIDVKLPPVELEVRCPGYEKWRPTATKDSAVPGRGRAYGPGLNFAAELRRTDGRKNGPLPKIASLEWRLSGTSREPGIAINFPYKSDDRRPDMEIVAADLTPPEDETAQAVVLHTPTGRVHEATVFPYDWGGWTTLRVTARLVDGRLIEGILRGGAHGNELKSIRVPATTPGSKIAWSWLREFCPHWKSDADDEDKIPAGKPGVDGDGYSVYEEYRGFYGAFGDHESTDPKKKDLFVCVNRFPHLQKGLVWFFLISGLEPRFLRNEELPRAGANERVVNCNVDAGPTCGPQTALYVIETMAFNTWNTPIPSGARPRSVPAIDVKDDFRSFLISKGLKYSAIFADEGQKARDSTVVRTLFQAVGVDRPGRPGGIAKLDFVTAPQDSKWKPHFLLNGQPVIIETEAGRDLAADTSNNLVRANSNLPPGATPITFSAHSVVVGTPGSAHSGPEECVMRDWFADLYQTHYARDGVKIYKYTLGTEQPGRVLGTTRKGTGVNDENRPQGSRYGDSNVEAPANKQLVVKDQAP